MDVTPSRYHRVQGLSRGLAILRVLNSEASGKSFITEIASRTGLHRTTVKRILETLQEDGYVQRNMADNSYSLNMKVRDLSDGFTDNEWISEIATPIMGKLLKQVQWPSDLTTLDGGAMLIRESTHRFSTLSFLKAMIGKRMPLLFSASGKAYLAAAGTAERRELVKIMITEGGRQAALAQTPNTVKNIIARVNSQGYATNEGEWIPDSKTHAIALPIKYQNKPLGCLNIVFLRKAMTIPDAAKEYLPTLQKAIVEIEKSIHKITIP